MTHRAGAEQFGSILGTVGDFSVSSCPKLAVWASAYCGAGGSCTELPQHRSDINFVLVCQPGERFQVGCGGEPKPLQLPLALTQVPRTVQAVSHQFGPLCSMALAQGAERVEALGRALVPRTYYTGNAPQELAALRNGLFALLRYPPYGGLLGLEQYRRRLTALRRITAESTASHQMKCNMNQPCSGQKVY